MTEQRIIRIEEVPKEHRKFLGDDKIFMFECEIVDDTLRLSLKEINCYSPYYYEAFFTLTSLCEKNNVFKACKSLEEVKSHILKLFNGAGVLKSVDDDEKILLMLKMYNISVVIQESFELERKTIEDKDEALMKLFNIQKNNINLFQKIIEKCKDDDYQDQKAAKDILNILQVN